jgi:hypothetical protein
MALTRPSENLLNLSQVIEAAYPVESEEPEQVETTFGPAIEFADAVTRSITFTRHWPYPVNTYGAVLELKIAASAAQNNNFRVRVKHRINGGSETTDTFTVSPGNNTNLFTANLTPLISAASLSTDAMLTFTISRLGADGNDSHTGTMRLYQTRLKAV